MRGFIIMPVSPKYNDFFDGDEPEGHQYWGDEAAGCIFVAKDTGRILLAQRGEEAEEPGTWGTWGGKIDGDETPKEAVAREVEEETGYDGIVKIHPLYVFQDGTFKYHNFLVVVPFEFTPQLNWENENSVWVEYGKWPEPLHFGLEALLQHAGPKIQKVIALLKKKRDTLKEMDAPPAIVKSAHSFSKEFLDYIKSAENLNKKGYKGGVWYPHASAEGGKPTIGYGHKIKDKAELKRLKSGLSDRTVERMLLSDLEHAKRQVYKDIEQMFGVKVPLDTKQEEILTDYAFNLGNIQGFPKFVRAVVDKDWETAGKEYKRFAGNKELARNKAFFNKYLRMEEALSGSPQGIKIEPQGLIDFGVYGYKWSAPHSYLSFGHDPNSRTFHLYMIQTPNEDDRNQGHATSLLEHFIRMVKANGGTLDVGSYTTSGMAFAKHVIERLANQYRVRLV